MVKRIIFWVLIINLFGFVSANILLKQKDKDILKILSTPIDDEYFGYGDGSERRNFYYGTMRQDKYRGVNLVPVYPEKLLLLGDYKIQMLMIAGVLEYRCEYDIEYYVFTDNPNKILVPFLFAEIPPKDLYNGYLYTCNYNML